MLSSQLGVGEGDKMARLYGEVETERNSKHQIGDEWIQTKLFYSKSVKDYKKDGNLLLCRAEVTINDEGVPTLTVTVGDGVKCNLVKNEDK